ncbi:filamentous hemagglutinin N-terminal domain-containing protein, partial [Pseudomonas sp. 1]
MDIRTPLNQCIALIVAGVLFLNPIVATAAQLTVDAAAKANTSINQAGNGVPIVNIATPNGSGLSTNTFRDYNVGSNGLILNNATSKTQSTQLGGIIIGNPNLRGQAAQVILNQVTGGNRSTLQGYTEVAGHAARVIVANPHGITCKGCGFINTPRATLTTGKPIMDGERLDRFQVDGGDIAIEGDALNARNLDQFDLITRSAKLNTELHARQLNIVTGRNDVQADTLQATPRAEDGSAKPLLAIDSAALGGMYANTIRLVGTEQGVGVKLAGNMAATTGDIQVDANGKVTLAQTSSAGNLKIAAPSAELTGKTYAAGSATVRVRDEVSVGQSLAARDSITVAGAQIDNQGIIEAGVEPDNTRNAHGDVTLTAQSLRNRGSVVANRTLEASASTLLDNQGGTFKGRATTLTAGQLDNRKGQALADDTLTVNAGTLDNRDQGLLQGKGQAVVDVSANLDNRGGRLVGQGGLQVTATRLDNRDKGLVGSDRQAKLTTHALLDNQGGGKLSADRLDITTAGLLNGGGQLLGGDVLVNASADIDNRLGLVSAKRLLDLKAVALDNSGKGNLRSDGTLGIKVATLDNRDNGLLSSLGDLTLHGSERLDNRGGLVLADRSLTVTGGHFDNRDKGVATTQGKARIDVASLANSDAGHLQSDGRLELVAGKVDNERLGNITAKGDLEAHLGTLNHQGGRLTSLGSLLLTADTLDNQQGGKIGATAVADISAARILNQQGEISSTGKVILNASQLLDNQGGKVIGDRGLTLTVQRLLNQNKGLLSGYDRLSLHGTELLNNGGKLSSHTHIDVTLDGQLDNSDAGLIVSDASVTLNTGTLLNRQGGKVSANAALDLTSQDLLDNQGGTLVTNAGLLLKAARLDNSHLGVISAQRHAELRSGAIDNSAKGNIGAGSLLLVATQLDNNDYGRISAAGQIDATLTGLDQNDHGQLVSETGIDLDLQHGRLVNRNGGLLRSPGSLLLRQMGVVDNRDAGEISSNQGFSLVASRLDNRGGRVVSSQDLTLRIAGILDNSLKGVLSASHDLEVGAGSLDNFSGGSLASGQALKATIDGQLDNHDEGILSAVGGLTVTSAGLLNGERGLLSGNTGVTVTTGQLDNHQGGQLISQAALTVDSSELDNRGGALSSKQAMKLTTGELRNGADALLRGGRIHSDGALTLEAAQVDSSQGGEISAKGDLLLRVSALIQRQGRLIGEQKLDLDLNGGDLQNQGGLISANGPLNIQNLRKLDNSAGEVTSQQSYQLLAQRIDNQQGRILSDGRLTVEAPLLDNSAKGLISGAQGLLAKGVDLNNSGEGTLSSKDGDLTVTLAGTLDNRELGALVSKGRQQISAANLHNSKGIVSSEQAITLSVSDQLDNSGGGLISATGDLAFDQDGTVIDNQGGQVNGQAITVTGKRLENAKGQLTSRALLELTLAEALVNTDGARLVSGADLLLNTGRVANNGGKLISHGLLRVDATTLDNSLGGNLASQQNLVLRLGGDLLNGQDGLLFSEHGKLDIHANALDNQAGTLKSQGAIEVRLDKALNNHGGRLESQAGGLELHAASLDNGGSGMLSAAKGLFKGVFAGLFDNGGGTTQAQSVDIKADTRVNNQGGYLSALGGDNQLVSAEFDNRGGGLYAAGLLHLQGQQLFNQSGKIGAGRIDFGLDGALYNGLGQLESEGDLLLRASELDNRTGNLRALGKTGTSRFIIAGNLLNDNGVLATANHDLDLQIGGLSNSGGQLLHTGLGTFGLASDKVTQAGGVLHTDGLLSIGAASWTNSSVLQARRLELDIGRFVQTASGKLLAVESFKGRGGDWSNDGLLASDGSLQLDLTGNYDGNGRLTSLGTLGLSATDIRLANSASLAAGAGGVVTARNLLSNDGRLTALDGLTVNAASLENRGTLGGAAAVTLTANNLSNQRGLVFSGNDMTLRVGSLSNYYGDIYSLGGLDLAGNGSARAVLLDNISASMESAGSMTLAVDTLLNRKEHLSSKQKLLAGYVNVYSDDRCKGKGCELYFSATESWQDVIDQDSPTAFITTGGKLNFAGGAFRNHYSSVSAAGDIAINTAVFENKGAGGGEQRNLTASMYTRDRGQYNAFINAKNQFNQNPGSLTLDQVMAASGYPHASIYNVIDNKTPIAGAVVAPAVVQSAGAVTINATQRIDNSVVRVNQAGAGTINTRGDATADARQAQTQVRALNPQLPPDLAQRQVNPVTLPSFSLPQGSNGLFRISSQAGQAAVSGDALGATAD